MHSAETVLRILSLDLSRADGMWSNALMKLGGSGQEANQPTLTAIWVFTFGAVFIKLHRVANVWLASRLLCWPTLPSRRCSARVTGRLG